MSDPEARAWNGETMLPCPFCGGTVDPEGWLGREEDPETGDALVRGPECNGCGATTPDMSIWNRRARRLPPAAPGADDAEALCERLSRGFEDAGEFTVVVDKADLRTALALLRGPR